MWFLSCSGTWLIRTESVSLQKEDHQNTQLAFAPTGETPVAETADSSHIAGVAAAGRERPFMATPDTQTDHQGHARITDRFGPRINPITGERQFHWGVDIAVPKGTRFGPLAPGTVTRVGKCGAAGLMITVRHRDGYETDYLHLQRVYVTVGQYVNRKEPIGETGSSGRSTGPHVHVSGRKDNRRVPPSQIVDWALARYGE